jgi:hypothetical protein
MANLTLGGPASLAFKDFEISSQYLGEVSVNLEDGERERTTLAGTFSANSGTIENAEATVTLFAPSMDWLGENLLRGRYNDGTPTGNIVWNVNNCSSDIGPMNIHFECEDNDANDVHFYNASLRANIEATYNESDFIEVELVFHANPDEDGNVARLGTGDLTQESEWDVETEETVAVTS